MKAEHRKELETNELADFIGRTVDTVKGKSKDRASWMPIAAVAGGLIVLVLGYLLFFRSVSGGNAAVMIKIQEAGDNVKELEKIAAENPGIPARTARFEAARIQYQEGLRDLPAPDTRAAAIGKLQAARDLYKKLAVETRDNVVLTQEALIQLARAEEALIGAVHPDNPGQAAGTLDQAMKYYQAAAESKPETFQTKAAAARLKVLEEKKSQIEAFYTKLNEQASKAKK